MKKIFVAILIISVICIGGGCSQNNENELTNPLKEDVSTVTVTYSSIYGSVPNKLEVGKGYVLTSRDLPLLDYTDYAFEGWFINDSKIEPNEYTVTEDIELAAKWVYERSGSAICLCFDDYYEEWDLIIDRYQDVVFNFFISGHLYRDDERIIHAIENGHNIGNHTQIHSYINSIPEEERDNFLTNDILEQKETIDSYGIINDCFAFPFGAFDRDWELRLQKIFRKLRRFGTPNNEPYWYTNQKFDSSIIISASSIDNIKFNDDTIFYDYCDGIIDYLVNNSNTTVCLVTHSIWDDDWGITIERLDYLISKAKENNIAFIKM